MSDRGAARIAVVGAGWAGLGCARLLSDAGCAIEVFDAAPQAGGRARGTRVPLAGTRVGVDNGQHLLIGAYTAVRRLLGLYAVPGGHCLQPAAFRICGAKAEMIGLAQHAWLEAQLGRWSASSSSSSSGISPQTRILIALRRISWILGSRRLPWAWVFGLRKLLEAALVRPPSPGQTLADQAAVLKLDPAMQRGFLAALAESALNASPAQACAARFALVLREAFGGLSPDSAYFLCANDDLSSLLPEALICGGPTGSKPLNICYRTRIAHLRASGPDALTLGLQGPRQWWLKAQHSPEYFGPFDAVVLALDPQSLSRLARDSLMVQSKAEGLQADSSGHPLHTLASAVERLPKACGIFTRWLALPRAAFAQPVLALPKALPTALPLPLSKSRHSESAWIFPRPGSRSYALAGLVVSAVDTRDQAAAIADRAIADLGLEVVDSFDIYERQAATPSFAGLEWPRFDLCSKDRLWLAGDWVGDGSDEALPATLESAARSAFAVARALQPAKS